MKAKQLKYRVMCVLTVLSMFCMAVSAQEVDTEQSVPKAQQRREGKQILAADSVAGVAAVADSVAIAVDSVARTMAKDVDEQVTVAMDSVNRSFTLTADSVALATSLPKKAFVPDPKKSMWLAIVFPGGGQIYNRKYWKLPLVYGGFLGCVYALNWNNTMYRDYSQAYIDIMDSDENTKSYENFIPKGYNIQNNLERLQNLFKRKKDFYRRYRDLSLFCMIGVYALSIVDAYVDAELSSFDISEDLAVKVHPTVIHDRFSAMRASGVGSQSYGLQCSFSF